MKFFQWLVCQLKHCLPAFLFFFVIFSLADITEILRSKFEVVTYYRFIVIVGASLVMAKVVLISDLLSITHVFAKKPLVYNTLWKSFIYLLCSIFVRFLEHAFPMYMESRSGLQIANHTLDMLRSDQFWIAQMWMALLLIIFVAYRELVVAVGEEKVRKLFLGK